MRVLAPGQLPMHRVTDPPAEAPHDPFSELASLFLTEREEEEVEGDAARSAPIEIALVGHLPVMGGLWLSQYADQVARRGGPTALVRLERGQTTVELLRAPGHRNGLESAESLDEALLMLAERAERWILCPQGETALDGPPAEESLTLLTGGDDAATVAAYRMIKSLAERRHAAHRPLPSIGLVVLGASPERVAEVAEKLDRTTKAFLDIDLRVTGQYQRMDAIESAGRRTFAGEEPGLAELCRRIELAEGRARRTGGRRGDETPSPAATVARPRPPLKLAPKPAFSRIESKPPVEPSEPVAPPPSPLEDEQLQAPATLPGLTLLAARCPRCEDVLLAIDAQGALHVMLPPERLAILPVVEAWALEHWELLRLIEPRLRPARPAKIDVDVVTSDAPSVAHLHGTGFALHLAIEGPGGAMHVALNLPSRS